MHPIRPVARFTPELQNWQSAFVVTSKWESPMRPNLLFRLRTLLLAGFIPLAFTGCACETSGTDAPVPEQEDGTCARHVDCNPGETCLQEIPNEPGVCVQVYCSADDDCGTGEECDALRGVCTREDLCNPADAQSCDASERCVVEGPTHRCQPEEEIPAPTSCTLGRSRIVLKDGASTDLHALGTLDGRPVRYSVFSFSSNVGTVEGSALTGECEGPESCGGDVFIRNQENEVCGSVDAIVHPPIPGTTFRLIAVDALSGEGLPGTVAIQAQTSEELLVATTTNEGVAVFPNLAADAVEAVSFFSATHRWTTYLAPGTKDVAMFIGANPTPEFGAGVKGSFAFDVASALSFGDIELALSGTALPFSGTDFELVNLAGPGRSTTVDIEGIFAVPQQWDLPLGMVARLGNVSVRDVFIAQATSPGPNLLWTIGGRSAVAESADLFTSPDDATFTEGALLKRFLRRFSRFSHGVRFGLDLRSQPLPSGGLGEVPDASWPFAVVQAQPTTPPVMQTVFEIPPLPCGGSDASCTPVDDVITLTSVYLPSQGLVPLGMLAESDDDDDGLVSSAFDTFAPGESPLFYAPAHDGLEGHLAVDIAFATTLDTFDVTSPDAAALIRVGEAHAPRVDFKSAFVGVPRIELDPDAETATVGPQTTDDFFRLRLSAPSGEWDVYGVAPAEGEAAIDLAALRPDAFDGRTSETATVKSFAFGTGYDRREIETFQDLIEFNGTDFSQSLLWVGAWTSRMCRGDRDDAACVISD